MDHYRWTLVAEAMGRAGFDAADKSRVKLVRPSDIAQIIPVIDECFSRQHFTWGDNPPLRWAVNNTKKCRSGKKQGTDTGNFYYAKIEAKSRKTDFYGACGINDHGADARHRAAAAGAANRRYIFLGVMQHRT